MAYDYTDPKRRNNPYALPDVEVWRDQIVDIVCPYCGVSEVSKQIAFATATAYCPSCGRDVSSYADTDPRLLSGEFGWFYRVGFPGCLPDSEPFGPFDSERAALDEARESAGVYDDDEPEEEEEEEETDRLDNED